MRFLRPGWLIELDCGLWAVDATQPLAAVLDPHDGQVRHVVTWPAVPPPQVHARPVVLGDGTSLWVQPHPGGPVVRIGLDGVAAAGWVGGPSHPLARQHLAACGPGAAWCATAAPEAEYVRRGEQPRTFLGYGQLQRVDAEGRVLTVAMDRGVQALRASPEGLLVAAVGDGHGLRRWDETQDRVSRDTRWYLLPWKLPWNQEPPQALTEDHALPRTFQPPPADDPSSLVSQDVPGHGPIARRGELEWFAEPSQQAPSGGRAWTRPLVSARDASGQVLASWDLADGWIETISASGSRLLLAVARRPRTWTSSAAQHPVDVIALDAADGSLTELLPAGSVDISEHCRPLRPRPLEADSYARQVLQEVQDRAGRLQQVGARDLEHRLEGSWPHTVLELTMSVLERSGVRLRRRVPLFDELGRILGPQYPDAHLVDQYQAHMLPPLSQARDGFLDV
ncbi:hypothetical protein GTQ99_02535 [Kineococcus sp. T13]|uniref:hypothetical protein n=1 Tax=Kineococcus vitellinus TaxID=2696565 RepID=UPI0014125BC9|nr:hypothetical protein [Kineococcus vitellinus]NAZ74303.1 hypothetical protein [Kineococcus vitellinus]